MRLIIHLQFGCILSCSCLCSSIRRQGLAFLARSTVHRRSITRGDVVLRLRGSERVVRKPDRVVSSFHQIESYQNLSEDRDTLVHITWCGARSAHRPARGCLARSPRASSLSPLLPFLLYVLGSRPSSGSQPSLVCQVAMPWTKPEGEGWRASRSPESRCSGTPL